MSPICQTFVQNAWRKDLCSNCFKSKEEHCCSGKEHDYNSGKEYGIDCKNSLTKRYVGVAGNSTMYSRNYYGKNSWNPIMLDNSNNESRILKSPGLIKGMDSFIKQENEKNCSLSGFSSEIEIVKSIPTTVINAPLSKNIPSDSWIISKIIGDTTEYNNNIKRNLEKQQGDSSSDLGSDTSHDISGSSGTNSCLGFDLQDADSDSNSIISASDSAQDEDPPTQSILKIPQHNDKLNKSQRASISFKNDIDVIGFGGDIDYSDDDYSDDDDDDNDSVSSSELTIEERELKHVTAKNTNFNSENENLEKDPSETSNIDNSPVSHPFLRSLSKEENKPESLVESPSLKQEGKVKLKRSIPLGGVKPQIKSNSSTSFANSGLDSGYLNDVENIPMKGIKPKYVSMDEEMKENYSYEEVYEREKVTSIDDISLSKITSFDDISLSKVTSIDDIAPKVDDIPKINSRNSAPCIKPIDDLLVLPSDGGNDATSENYIEENCETASNGLLLIDSTKDVEQINEKSSHCCNSISDVCAVISESKFTLCNSNELRKLNLSPDADGNDKGISNVVNLSKPYDSLNGEKSVYDFSVKSAQNNMFVIQHSDNRTFKQDNNTLSFGDKEKSNEIENSKKNLEKVRSAVIPLNYINIQRRNSFLESQLAGTVYTGTLDTHLINEKKINHKVCAINSTCKNINPIISNLVDHSQLNIEPLNSNTVKNSYYSSKVDVPIPPCSQVDEKPIQNEAKENCISYISSPGIDCTSSKSCENIVSSAEHILSKRSVSSNSLSTFGTLMTPTQTPQSSFLHSGVVCPVKDTSMVNSVIYSTPDFLFNIKNPLKDTPMTASIQKSALYASATCLKGLQSGKPATTPKPAMLKEKPRIATKPGIGSSHIYQLSTPIIKTLSENVYSSTVQVTPKRPISINGNVEGFNYSNTVNSSELSTSLNLLENRKPPPTNQAPEVPKMKSKCEENVYDVPVILGSSTPTSVTVSAPSPTSSSSGYSTTSNISQQEINESEIHQNNLLEKESYLPLSDINTITAECSTVSTTLAMATSAAVTSRKEDPNKSHYASTFEANRNMLSANLCFHNDSQVLTSNQTNNSKKLKFDDENSFTDLESKPVHSAQEIEMPEKVEKNSLSSHTSNHTLNTMNLQAHSMQHSYVNIQPPFENHDIDSYSSFTDDFDDDDDDVNPESDSNVLRRTERSSSSAPMFRNSVGPVNFPSSYGSEFGSSNILDGISKAPAVRSHSVPRAVESSVKLNLFGKCKTESSSKFGFVKTGFFRPSSPPSVNRKLSSDRGRDRTKKSNSGFSLRKLLRLGSSDKHKCPKEQKSLKDAERESQREARKLQLQIIHPLDYNPNGVEVIARPEKRSPAYDIYGSSFQEFLQHPKLDNLEDKNSHLTTGEKFKNNEPALNSLDQTRNLKKGEKFSKAMKKNSFLRKKRKNVEQKDSIKNETRPVITYVRRPSASSSNTTATTSLNDYAKCINISNVITTDRIGETTSFGSLNNQPTTINLGFNSEGRPRPPPPPRKTSLETANHEVFLIPTNPPPLCTNSSQEGLSCQRSEADTASLCSNSSLNRPNRPPPPRRTPSAASSIKVGGCRPPVGRDNVYANLGNARASFTPRKPGRSSSIRDEEREKRRAPNPPPSSLNEATNNRITKGLAPPTPLNNDHDYEYITENSPEKTNQLNQRGIPSTLSSLHEKMKVDVGNTTNAITNLSLEDQYGAVVNANLEALSNMLDQICKQSESHADKKICRNIKHLADVNLVSTVPVACGPRLFYSATYSNEKLTVMVTPEAKVEVDPLLMPNPIVAFREDLPSSFLNSRKLLDKQSKISSSVWVLPPLVISSLEEFSDVSQRLLREEPFAWEKRICFFLLQMVTALKQLQAKGIEETSLHLFLVIDNMKQSLSPRLLMAFPSTAGDIANANGNYWSLCQCAAAATLLFLGHSNPLQAVINGPVLAPPFTPSPHAFTTLVDTLREERASSLTKAKCILEAILFGPVNLCRSSEPKVDITIQKWLDLERATVLHSLVKEQAKDDVRKYASLLTKFQLFFLVRTNVKALVEALRVLEGPDVTNL